MKHTLEYAAAACALRLFRLLPLPLALCTGEVLGYLLFSLVKTRRKVAMRNLATAFPTLQPRAREGIASDCYRNMGLSLAEFAHMDAWVRDGVRFANLPLVRRLLENGKGAVVVTGHFGNWEALAAASALRGVPLSVVARPQRNRAVSDLINRYRRRHGMGVLPATMPGVRGALKALRRGRVVAFLADQDAGRKGVFVDFLGRPASATTTPVALAMKTGAPLIPCYILRHGRAKHTVVFEQPVSMDSDVPPAQLVADSLANRVRSRPELYFWVHRRWKTQPATRTP